MVNNLGSKDTIADVLEQLEIKVYIFLNIRHITYFLISFLLFQ